MTKRIGVQIQYMSPEGLVDSETCHPNNEEAIAFFSDYVKEWFEKVKEYDGIQVHGEGRPLLMFFLCDVHGSKE